MHDLRHFHATFLLAAGVPAKIISESLGHSDIRITLDIYSHVLPESHRSAAEIVDNLWNKGK
ncbi:tyrosine-type recombinase/integrase [Carboxydothermus ferrireducens]|uniref:tyrosine-type recombinase/integrase n=1 Tax=Carboxydothermus ferrireducens TaxID=54265 RepID=UPI002ADD31F2|nr:tyrosine-type recombinase/integrase [Carboxydothermus ferrireducens]